MILCTTFFAKMFDYQIKQQPLELLQADDRRKLIDFAMLNMKVQDLTEKQMDKING